MKNLYEEMSFWDRLYIPALIKGLFTTLKHIPRAKRNTSYQYPEDQRSVDERNERYRGIHKLTVDDLPRGKDPCGVNGRGTDEEGNPIAGGGTGGVTITFT